ncbi:hypothetical protein [Natrinema saccharevitans]|uniref:hypothetical protein n=1 Tax=Natrinema saccharevitans TaxID=301967 RepID=UPI0011155DE7|nr:hypothetical protein [Natrinema saccharevitans]
MGDLPEVTTTALSLEHDRTADGCNVSTAVAELSTGVTIRLQIADHFIGISELPGVERELTILAHPANQVTAQEVNTPRITTPAVWYSQWNADCYGIVKDREVDALPRADVQFDILDVGVGSIYLHPTVREYLPESELPLHYGDTLYVSASPLVMWEPHS